MSPDQDLRAAAFTSQSIPEQYERLLAPVVFEPWAEVLLDTVGMAPGAAVVDIASGTGVAARAAARRAGPSGRVVATDVSQAMLEVSAAQPLPEAAAPIEFRAAPATALDLPDGEFDVAICQQGLPFFTDRPAAIAEMHRVLRPGGVVGVGVWVAGLPIAPFDTYIELLSSHAIAPPFPGAFDGESFKMSVDEVEQVLLEAGFAAAQIKAVELPLSWPDANSAAAGIMGTPFANAVAALAGERRESFMAALASAFGSEGPVQRLSTAVIGRAVA